MSRRMLRLVALIALIGLLSGCDAISRVVPRDNDVVAPPPVVVNPTAVPQPAAPPVVEKPVNPTVPPMTEKPAAPKPTDTPTDLCLNVSGAQSSVPDGMVADGKGNCVPMAPTPAPQPTMAPTAAAAKPSSPAPAASVPSQAPAPAVSAPAIAHPTGSTMRPLVEDCIDDATMQRLHGGDVQKMKPVFNGVFWDNCKWLVGKSLVPFKLHMVPGFSYVGASALPGEPVFAFWGDGQTREMYGSTIRYLPAYIKGYQRALEQAQRSGKEEDWLQAEKLGKWLDGCGMLRSVEWFGHDTGEDGYVRNPSYHTYTGNVACDDYVHPPHESVKDKLMGPLMPNGQPLQLGNFLDPIREKGPAGYLRPEYKTGQVPHKDNSPSPAPPQPVGSQPNPSSSAPAAAPTQTSAPQAAAKPSGDTNHPQCPKTPEEAANLLSGGVGTWENRGYGEYNQRTWVLWKYKADGGKKVTLKWPGFGYYHHFSVPGDKPIYRDIAGANSGSFNCDSRDPSQVSELSHDDRIVAFVPHPKMHIVRLEEDELRITA